MYELTVTDDIAAAHFLMGYEGPCKDLHGHTWKVEVTVQSQELNAIGLVIDFKVIRDRLKGFLSHLDHVHLNNLDHFKEINPSTENLARYIFRGFGKEIKPLRIKQVRVWESETSSVVYYE